MDAKLQKLISFLDCAHSPYHAQALCCRELEAQGFTKLAPGKPWTLAPGGKYYVTRGGTALMAIRIPMESPAGFLISAAHTDRPTFKVKENGELAGTYNQLAVERYGGQILSTWLDRPLSAAGRVMVKTPQGAKSVLVDIDRDLLLIPSVAIHMNRQVNDGYKWNPAVDTIPLLGSGSTKGEFFKLLTDAADGEILGHDLVLYPRQKCSLWGVEKEYLSAGGLDDLACVWGCLQGVLEGVSKNSISVFAALDSEEVGSASVQGAASTFLRDTLQAIADGLQLPLTALLQNTALVSADNGHAIHPNHPELADPANAPVMGKGVLLKFNATLKYCTDGMGAAMLRSVAEKAGVNLQTYCNRADIPGGSTLGCISLSQVSVPTVDIGLPQLAMHSCYETAAVSDCLDLMQLMKGYYSGTLIMDEDGFEIR